MNDLETWRKKRANLDYCPWPGPRPMLRASAGTKQLVGREAEAELFATRVLEHAVVVLSGESGVGKTSMLNVELKPMLVRSGFHVLVCDEWNPGNGQIEPENFIAQRVKAQLPKRVVVDSGESLIEQLHRRYPDGVVLLLDQFEELIRYHPALFRRTLRWIEKISSRYRIRIVLSLRSEYEHRLSALNLAPFKQTRFELEPLTSEEIARQIVASADSDQPPITTAATELIVDRWRDELEDEITGVGLLHLQALLYVLWMQKATGVITEDDVKRMIERRNEESLFGHALAESVGSRLRSCEAACSPDADTGWDGIDPVVSSQTLALVVAITRHLASGDFKLTQERERLAQIVLEEDSAEVLALTDPALPLPGHDYHSAVVRLTTAVDTDAARGDSDNDEEFDRVDWLSITRTDLGFHASEGDQPPWDLDPQDACAGTLMGLTLGDALIERRRQFYFAIEWLRASSLVRVTTPATSQTMISLVHDRYARGLHHWRQERPDRPDAELTRLTAVRGRTFSWTRQEAMPEFHSSVIPNIRWLSCRVTARLKEVVFVNCDFRGSTFLNCIFEGVVFVNCLLDDVDFVGCQIIGTPDQVEGTFSQPQLEGLPSFYVEAPPSVLQSFRRIRGGTNENVLRHLFSETSGVPAIPVMHSDHPRTVPWKPHTAGLTMYGGRLSSLMLRGCQFGEDGLLSLRHIAGTSLEIAEQEHARADIFAAAIRGLTVTRPIRRSSTQPGRFDFTITAAHIINAWFGVGLHGEAHFNNCVVWQLFNASDPGDFDVRVDDSPNFGLVNTQEPELDADDRFTTLGMTADARQAVEALSERVDYRSRPAVYELTDVLDEER